MKKFLAAAVATAWAATGIAADNLLPPTPAQPVHWRVELTPAGAKAGDEVEIVFDAQITSGWILYSSDFNLEIGPRPAKFTFDPNAGLTLVGAIQPVKPQWKTDRTLGGKYSFFAEHAQFRQKARLTGDAGEVSGRITGQTCFEESGLCQLFRDTFKATATP
jgi:cytochrome c biogenesis DsbD-like protein